MVALEMCVTLLVLMIMEYSYLGIILQLNLHLEDLPKVHIKPQNQ